jgi:hypothetical protein
MCIARMEHCLGVLFWLVGYIILFAAASGYLELEKEHPKESFRFFTLDKLFFPWNIFYKRTSERLHWTKTFQ